MALIRRSALATWALFMLPFLAACGTLEVIPAGERQDSQTVVLEGYWRYLFLYEEQLGISSVDGRRATGLLGHVGLVRLPAGRHWIEVRVDRNGGRIARCAFELKFDAQIHYQIEALKVDGLLAHPVSSPYKGSLRIATAAAGKPVQTLNVGVACTSGELLCLQDSECSPDYSCHVARGFDFGTCEADSH